MLFWLKFIANTVALMIGNHTLGTNVTRTSFAEVLCLLLRMDQAKLINKTLLRLNVRIINSSDAVDALGHTGRPIFVLFIIDVIW